MLPCWENLKFVQAGTNVFSTMQCCSALLMSDTDEYLAFLRCCFSVALSLLCRL